MVGNEKKEGQIPRAFSATPQSLNYYFSPQSILVVIGSHRRI